MADKKITKREVINSMLANEVVKANSEWVAYLENEIALMDKKNEKRAEKNAEKASTKSDIMDKVYEGMIAIGKPATLTEMVKAIECIADYSTQKLNPIVQTLVKEGRVVHKKEGRKSLYLVA